MENKLTVIEIEEGGADRHDFDGWKPLRKFLKETRHFKFSDTELRDILNWIKGNEPGAILNFRKGWIIIRESGL